MFYARENVINDRKRRGLIFVTTGLLSNGRPVEYGRPLYFHHVICSSSFFFLFSSPNLSRRRLDVCRTSTQGVALVRI